MVSETKPLIKQATLTVQTDLSEIIRVVNWFDHFTCSSLPHDSRVEGQMALIEGFTNAVRHAHQHLHNTTPIKIDGQISDQRFQLSIWDYGKPFDFEANLLRLSQLTSSPDFDPYIRENQWGSIIMLRLRTRHGWNISYHHQPSIRNCLLLEKNL